MGCWSPGLIIRGAFSLANSSADSVACFLAAAMSRSNESASCLAPRARAKAFDAEVVALLDSSSARLEESSAVRDCVRAVAELPRAVFALRSASSAFSLREPISIPDRILVLTRHISSSDNATISSKVERFASRSLRSFIPHVNQFLNSATYSPAQAMVTNPAQMYSPISQRDSDLDRDATSEAVRVILAHKRREKLALLGCLIPLLLLLGAHGVAACREFTMRLKAKHKQPVKRQYSA